MASMEMMDKMIRLRECQREGIPLLHVVLHVLGACCAIAIIASIAMCNQNKFEGVYFEVPSISPQYTLDVSTIVDGFIPNKECINVGIFVLTVAIYQSRRYMNLYMPLVMLAAWNEWKHWDAEASVKINLLQSIRLLILLMFVPFIVYLWRMCNKIPSVKECTLKVWTKIIITSYNEATDFKSMMTCLDPIKQLTVIFTYVMKFIREYMMLSKLQLETSAAVASNAVSAIMPWVSSGASTIFVAASAKAAGLGLVPGAIPVVAGVGLVSIGAGAYAYYRPACLFADDSKEESTKESTLGKGGDVMQMMNPLAQGVVFTSALIEYLGTAIAVFILMIILLHFGYVIIKATDELSMESETATTKSGESSELQRECRNAIMKLLRLLVLVLFLSVMATTYMLKEPADPLLVRNKELHAGYAKANATVTSLQEKLDNLQKAAELATTTAQTQIKTIANLKAKVKHHEENDKAIAATNHENYLKWENLGYKRAQQQTNANCHRATETPSSEPLVQKIFDAYKSVRIANNSKGMRVGVNAAEVTKHILPYIHEQMVNNTERLTRSNDEIMAAAGEAVDLLKAEHGAYFFGPCQTSAGECEKFTDVTTKVQRGVKELIASMQAFSIKSVLVNTKTHLEEEKKTLTTDDLLNMNTNMIGYLDHVLDKWPKHLDNVIVNWQFEGMDLLREQFFNRKDFCANQQINRIKRLFIYNNFWGWGRQTPVLLPTSGVNNDTITELQTEFSRLCEMSNTLRSVHEVLSTDLPHYTFAFTDLPEHVQQNLKLLQEKQYDKISVGVMHALSSSNTIKRLIELEDVSELMRATGAIVEQQQATTAGDLAVGFTPL